MKHVRMELAVRLIDLAMWLHRDISLQYFENLIATAKLEKLRGEG